MSITNPTSSVCLRTDPISGALSRGCFRWSTESWFLLLSSHYIVLTGRCISRAWVYMPSFYSQSSPVVNCICHNEQAGYEIDDDDNSPYYSNPVSVTIIITRLFTDCFRPQVPCVFHSLLLYLREILILDKLYLCFKLAIEYLSFVRDNKHVRVITESMNDLHKVVDTCFIQRWVKGFVQYQ